MIIVFGLSQVNYSNSFLFWNFLAETKYNDMLCRMPVFSLHEKKMWIKLKILFNLPLPIRNHFYKGRRLTFSKHWFCKSCYNVFDLKPWSKYKKLSFSDLCCPICSSKSFYSGTEISKAIIDKKSTADILEIIKKLKNEFIKHEQFK